MSTVVHGVGARELPRPLRTGKGCNAMYEGLTRVVRATATEYWQGNIRGKPGDGTEWQIGALYNVPTAAGLVFLAEGHDFEQSAIVDGKYSPIILKMSTVEQEAIDAIAAHARKAQDPTFGRK